MKFLSLKYWFSLYPGTLSNQAEKLLIGIFVFFFILTLLCQILARRKKDPPVSKFFQKFFYFWLFLGFMSLILFFFRYEEVPLLSSRFWWLALGIAALIWLGFILRYLTGLPKIKERLKEKEQFEKYLPKKGHKP